MHKAPLPSASFIAACNSTTVISPSPSLSASRNTARSARLPPPLLLPPPPLPHAPPFPAPQDGRRPRGDWGGEHTSPYYTQVDIKDEGRRFTTESFRIYTALNILVC